MTTPCRLECWIVFLTRYQAVIGQDISLAFFWIHEVQTNNWASLPGDDIFCWFWLDSNFTGQWLFHDWHKCYSYQWLGPDGSCVMCQSLSYSAANQYREEAETWQALRSIKATTARACLTANWSRQHHDTVPHRPPPNRRHTTPATLVSPIDNTKDTNHHNTDE